MIPATKRDSAYAGRLKLTVDGKFFPLTTTAPAENNMRSVAGNGNGATPDGASRSANLAGRERRAAFEKIKRCYPQSHVGDDDENAFAAFKLALDVGNTVAGMIEDAKDTACAAREDDDVPELVEFLVSKCWVETPTAALN